MDKHDRPYKCVAKRCEGLQGFTHSGGLRRHEREVHKMHGAAERSLFCPFTDCKRGSGAGFTRKENRAEHIRRVHRHTTTTSEIPGLTVPLATTIHSAPTGSRRHSRPACVCTIEPDHSKRRPLKRKRGIDSTLPESDSECQHAVIERKVRAHREYDKRLQQLEEDLKARQQTRR